MKNSTSISLVKEEDAVTMENLSDDDSEETSIMENKIENPALNEQTESVSTVIFRRKILLISKLDFWPFLKWQKMDFVQKKKFREIENFEFFIIKIGIAIRNKWRRYF